ncbi:ureidoglycolate hydrolase [Betaproteobacteria bacterium GR16-43]|nr:ureidoglycolate hydrolase [Betaproteobacteria bacterium GR16-43]
MSVDSYLAPELPETLDVVDVPVVRATEESLRGYGRLVDDPKHCAIEIVTWPQPGWRPMDEGTGNEGGTTHGEFDFWWEGDVLFGKNNAVASNEYLFGWSCDPKEAKRERQTVPRSQVLLWHANYHPDGGQLFFPRNGEAFVCPLAKPGDDVKPEDFVAFHVDGGKGLYIHPNIWHEAVFPIADRARFYDEQGKVHARISCNFAKEFGVLLGVRLAP